MQPHKKHQEELMGLLEENKETVLEWCKLFSKMERILDKVPKHISRDKFYKAIELFAEKHNIDLDLT